MLAEMQRDAIALDSHVERRLRVEAVLEGDPEAEKAEVEIAAFSTEKMRRMGMAG
jgi:hypothetical protein